MQSFILQVDESLVRLLLLPGMLIQICILVIKKIISKQEKQAIWYDTK